MSIISVISMRSFSAAIAIGLLGASCSTPGRLSPVPPTLTDRAVPVAGASRYVLGQDPQILAKMFMDSFEREQAYLRSIGHTGPLPPVSFLSISGGGGNGAFGAGLLSGWPDKDRPAFKAVTGISTGALIAPFAFLGPKYNPALRETYTKVNDDGIFKKRGLVKAFFGDAMADSDPLQQLVAKYVTQSFLDEIAAEHAKGRLLLVGTTDLDARRGVIWDMTALAASSDPAAITLFRNILVASASIPGALPPVMMDVTVDGQPYSEMHVDGGVSAQVFLYPPRFNLGAASAAAGAERERHVYIIRNARLEADWAGVDRRTFTIAGSAVSTLIHNQGTGDLLRIYTTTQRDGMDYNLAFIPKDFTVVSKSQFDTNYMKQLFERAHAMASAGYPWQQYPPGIDPVAAAAPR